MIEEGIKYEVATITPMMLLQTAVNSNADLDKMEKLMALQERWEASEARKSYVRAMAAFKTDPPTIIKSRTADFTTQKGRTVYEYADLASVAAIVSKALSAHGLSHSWRLEQGDRITVTCTITHEMGHSESCSLSADADLSGGKNPIQAIGSATSYLEKYTLLALTGLAAQGQDDDGQAVETPEYVSAEQVANLLSLIKEVKANENAFCKYFKTALVETLPAKDYQRAVNMLESKRKPERQPGDEDIQS
jgi:hypothetical protein